MKLVPDIQYNHNHNSVADWFYFQWNTFLSERNQETLSAAFSFLNAGGWTCINTTKGFLKLQNYILTHFGLILSALHQGSLVARRKESTSEKCISFMKQAGGLPYLNNSNKSFCPRWNWMGTKVHVASGLLERKSQTQWWSENIFQLQATMWDIFFSVFIFCTVFFTSTYMH